MEIGNLILPLISGVPLGRSQFPHLQNKEFIIDYL